MYSVNFNLVPEQRSYEPRWIGEIEIEGEIEKGIINNNAQNKEIFPKLWCQKCSATKGKTAIDNKIPTKGRTQKIARSCPLRWGAPSAPAKIILGKMNRNNKNIL